MFYEYAVDPEILADLDNCRVFFEAFEAKPGRLVSDVPKKWLWLALGEIKKIPHEQCGPRKRSYLKERLKKFSKNSLIRTRTADAGISQRSWLKFAIEQNGEYPFSAILSLTEKSESAVVHDFGELFFSPPSCWECNGQSHIERKAPQIVNSMTPLLKVSKSVHLVDPYFSFFHPSCDQSKPVLKELIAKLPLFNIGKGIKDICIHISNKKIVTKEHLQEITQPWLRQGVTLKVSHWPQDQMHNRFVLTDVGGLQYGYGLSEHTQSNLKEDLVSVLTHKSYEKEFKKIISKEPESKCEVTGTKP